MGSSSLWAVRAAAPDLIIPVRSFWRSVRLQPDEVMVKLREMAALSPTSVAASQLPKQFSVTMMLAGVVFESAVFNAASLMKRRNR